jgi:hypothetical protein
MAIERALDEIEREVGRFDAYQRIAVIQTLERLERDVTVHVKGFCGWC